MITKGFRGVFTGMRWTAAFLLFVATAITSFNAITRYAFGFVIYGSEELCAYIVLIMAYMLFPVLEAENRHLKIDIFSSSNVNRKIKDVVYTIRGVISLAVYGILVYFGWQVIATARKFQSASPTLRIPKSAAFGLLEIFIAVAFLGWLCILLFNKRRPL